jgi:hypothetical protein
MLSEASRPRREELDPLSSNGLCEALITMPPKDAAPA